MSFSYINTSLSFWFPQQIPQGSPTFFPHLPSHYSTGKPGLLLLQLISIQPLKAIRTQRHLKLSKSPFAFPNSLLLARHTEWNNSPSEQETTAPSCSAAPPSYKELAFCRAGFGYVPAPAEWHSHLSLCYSFVAIGVK